MKSSRNIERSDLRIFEGEVKKLLIFAGLWKDDFPAFQFAQTKWNTRFTNFEFGQVFESPYHFLLRENLLYFGELDEGRCLHGKGTANYLDEGLVYKGGFQKGRWSEQGKVYIDHVERFDGFFVNGYFEGEGKLFYKDGHRYFGGFKKGNLEGHGRMDAPDKSSFRGYFKNGRRQGEGTTTFADFSYEKVDYVEGVKEGKAVFVKKSEGKSDLYFERRYNKGSQITEKKRKKIPSLKKGLCCWSG